MTPRSMTFIVDGDPQPNPKERVTKSGRTYKRDNKKKTLKVWGSYLRVMVQLQVREQFGRELPFPNGTPIRLGVEVRIRKAKSNKKLCPTQTPDWSNYYYYIENLLEGIVYHDDRDVQGPLPGDKRWCLWDEKPGVTITVTEVDTGELRLI